MTKIIFLKKKEKSGFTLIEALTLLFIFSVIVVTFYNFFTSGTNLILETKKKLIALNAANEKIEILRGKAYGDIEIGSTDEQLSYGNYQFHVITSVSYKDDEYDGDGEDDDSPNDYKNAIVTVRWGNEGDSQTVTMSSSIAPFGEEVGVGGGILNVSAIDIDGNPVSGVQVRVTNSSPSYDQTLTTNANGSASFIGITQDNQGYEISLSKSDYEGDVSTLPPYPTTAYYPSNVHASVVDGSTTNSVFSFSRTSDFKVKFINPVDNLPVESVNFSMEGGRVIGTNVDTTLVHNYDESSLVSNSDGEKNISDVSPGQYAITVNEPGYVFWKMEGSSGNNANEILISQGESGDTKNVLLLDENTDSYFVRIVDSVTGAALEGAQISIENESLSFSDTIETDEYGYAFSPAKSEPSKSFENGQTYDIEITKSGYQTKTGSVKIDKLTQDTISLDPQ